MLRQQLQEVEVRNKNQGRHKTQKLGQLLLKQSLNSKNEAKDDQVTEKAPVCKELHHKYKENVIKTMLAQYVLKQVRYTLQQQVENRDLKKDEALKAYDEKQQELVGSDRVLMKQLIHPGGVA